MNRLGFMAAVCKRFSIKLDELEKTRKLRRKELGGLGRVD